MGVYSSDKKTGATISRNPLILLWSGRRVSNPQPSAWKADALPVELLPLFSFAEPFYSTAVSLRSIENISGVYPFFALFGFAYLLW